MACAQWPTLPRESPGHLADWPVRRSLTVPDDKRTHAPLRAVIRPGVPLGPWSILREGSHICSAVHRLAVSGTHEKESYKHIPFDRPLACTMAPRLSPLLTFCEMCVVSAIKNAIVRWRSSPPSFFPKISASGGILLLPLSAGLQTSSTRRPPLESATAWATGEDQQAKTRG